MLNLENISNSYNEHARKVWNILHLKSVSDYHDIYIQTDTLLLTDIFENF